MHVKDWAKFAVALWSALLGLIGTWLISKRYAREFGRSLFFALLAPLFWIVGKGIHFRRFLDARAANSSDLPDKRTDLVMGLLLLFWSFFLQLVLPFFDWKH